MKARTKRAGPTPDWATHIAKPKAQQMVGTRDPKKLYCSNYVGLLRGNKEDCAERLGNPDGKVKGPIDGAGNGSDEGALLKIVGLLKVGLIEGDKERAGPKR